MLYVLAGLAFLSGCVLGQKDSLSGLCQATLVEWRMVWPQMLVNAFLASFEF